MDSEKQLSFFLLGLGVGVAAGIIFAPQSGRETRGLIREKADGSRDYLKRRGGELRETAGDLVDRGREAIGRQRQQFSEAIDAGKQAYKETVNEGPSTT
ncbi:MAG: YtxH domain-containing protein [Bryobacteraceae bacterium]